MRNNGQLISFLRQHNQTMSQEFCSPDAALWRRKYRQEHPTEIAALKCMDGRLNLALMTKTPPGIIQPFRNIGGIFDLGWPYFGALMREWVDYSISRSRLCLVFITYHFAKGDTHRGCKGHSYDTAAAQQAASRLLQQFETVFGNKHSVVYPILVGIETDDDALVIHGRNGERLNLAELANPSPDDLRARLQAFFPEMQTQIVDDLLPLLQGNLEHIAAVRATNRPVTDVEHREQILAVGRGFDWLHVPNKALIVGPYSYDVAAPIATAGKVLLENLQQNRIPKDEGVVLLASAVYRDAAGPERLLAAEKAKSLAALATTTIEREVPELTDYLKTLVGTTNINTRLFNAIE